MSIILLGGAGYIGTAFRNELEKRQIEFRSVSRREVDYTNLSTLTEFLRVSRPEFLINAAGYTGKPNVDACENDKAMCLSGNAVLPGIIRQACELTNTPWGHVSSGCIYTGSRHDGTGFTEQDPPNFCFRTNNCSFYSGTKALGEECLAGADSTYIWRLRIPFDHVDSPRNYLSKLMRYDRLLDATNSISQLQEFVNACLQCWTKRVPFGIYHVTNTGSMTTRQIVAMIQTHLKPNKSFDFFESENEFMQVAAKTPRSNCIMSNQKLREAGIEMSTIEDAIERALLAWRS